eukprot:scaffold22078_cov33-Tisochrysis_lutea.AAC.3
MLIKRPLPAPVDLQGRGEPAREGQEGGHTNITQHERCRNLRKFPTATTEAEGSRPLRAPGTRKKVCPSLSPSPGPK